MPNYEGDGGSQNPYQAQTTSTTAPSSSSSDWTTKDTLDSFGLFYNYLQNQNQSSDAANNIASGYAADNPFNPYRGMYAAEMFNLQQNPGDIINTPGYQFSYDQGLQSLFAKQAASGNRFSGRALTETMKFGQGLASQMYNSEMDRLMALSGASFAPSGGLTAAQLQSQNSSQSNFNDMYLYKSLVDQFYDDPNQDQWTPYQGG